MQVDRPDVLLSPDSRALLILTTNDRAPRAWVPPTAQIDMKDVNIDAAIATLYASDRSATYRPPISPLMR